MNINLRSRSLAAAITSLFAFAGCSSSGASSDPDSLSLEDFGPALEYAVCEGVKRCCNLGNVDKVEPRCRQLVRDYVAVVAEINDGNSSTEWDRKAAAECVNMWKALGASCEATPVEYCVNDMRGRGSWLERFWKGKIAEGGQCGESLECADSLYCIEHAQNRSCRDIVHRTVGERCEIQSMPSRLRGTVAIAEEAAEYGTCYFSDGLKCDRISQTCVRHKAIAESCAGEFDCADGLYCHATTRVCTGKEPLRTLCHSDPECESGACANGYCKEPVRGVCERTQSQIMSGTL